jgi:hypothetical protein
MSTAGAGTGSGIALALVRRDSRFLSMNIFIDGHSAIGKDVFVCSGISIKTNGQRSF